MSRSRTKSAALMVLLCVLMIGFYISTTHMLWLISEDVTISAPFLVEDYPK